MKDKIKEVLDQWDLSCSEEADIKDELATQIAKALEPKYHDVEEFYQDDPYSYWPCCDVEGCDQVSCRGGGCWSDTGYWSVCPDHSQMFRDGKPQPQMKQSAIDREKSRDEDGCLPIKQPEATEGKECPKGYKFRRHWCMDCDFFDNCDFGTSKHEKFMEPEPEGKGLCHCIHSCKWDTLEKDKNKCDNCGKTIYQKLYNKPESLQWESKPTEPEGANMGTVLTEKMVEDHKLTGGYKDWDVKPEEAKEWDNKVIEHLHSLDMPDFFLEIYASRDTFSRAKIMEMFRDYHIHKVANIKKVMQEKLDESKDELNDPMLNSGALGYFEGRETVLIELLTEL